MAAGHRSPICSVSYLLTMTIRLAADIGGTFTDVVLEVDGGTPDLRQFSAKVLTTHHAPAEAVIDGVLEVLAASAVDPSAIELIIHGTTLATNALIERRGSKTALLVTEGFRDSIAMAHENRFEQYDLFMQRPDPLVPRHLCLPVPERSAADGSVLLDLDEQAVLDFVPLLEREDVRSVAIGFLHSYVNPVHERRAAALLRDRLPHLSVTLSSDICPEIREYERLSTATANAYVQPLMAAYLTDLEQRLEKLGAVAPLLLMLSNGGLCTLETAVRSPVGLVESGPAGGALLAAQVAAELGIDNLLSFDMGGTTAKLCLLAAGKPATSREFEVARVYRFLKGSGLPLRIPVIDLVEIGAGGGSVASIDQLGRVNVGPESAGSEPGPAGYGRGGTAPTVTDADISAGRIAPEWFAGGAMGLDVNASRRALQTGVAKPLGVDLDAAIVAVGEIVAENMANAARVHAVERGRDLAGGSMVAFGGAAPLHACRLADRLGLDTVIVPPGAGVGSAIGFLRAPISYEVVRTAHQRLDRFDHDTVNRVLGELRAEARGVVDGATEPGTPTEEVLYASMRYRGQGHEIDVAVPVDQFAPGDETILLAAFDEAYRSHYTRLIPGMVAEVLTWRLRVNTISALPVTCPEPQPLPFEATNFRQVLDPTDGWLSFAVIPRASLQPGHHLSGPALLVEDQTTTVVGPGFNARVDGRGYLLLERIRTRTAVEARSGDLIGLQVMWNRLIAIVEEQAQVLMRAAFSTSTREAGDLSAGVFDRSGRMLAQSVTGTPGHVNSMAASVIHFLDEFPIDTMKPGDVFLTNDPWKGTGHLYDFVVVTPVFHPQRPADGVIALFACTSHVVDVGGVGFSMEGREVFHEGLYLPLLQLAKDGILDVNVLKIIRANSRAPDMVDGDVHSLAACNDRGALRLIEMMDEFGLVQLDTLADHVIDRSREAMERLIRALPDGRWTNTMRIDGVDEPLDLVAELRISGSRIDVDFTGTSPQSTWGINVPMAYADAYTSFGVRCIIGPDVPNNAGSLGVINVTAPQGSILNAPFPAPVNVRHVVGQMLPDTVFGCLTQILPDRVPAEGTSSLWNILIDGHWADGERYVIMSFHSGGAGARPNADGLSATAFPSGVRNMPVEINEAISPIVFWRKELRPDSGGAGRFRGGHGQLIDIANREGSPFSISATYERTKHPARGRNGGDPGATGHLALASGPTVKPLGRTEIPAGDRLLMAFPGGGGFGEPADRDPDVLDQERLTGLVTE